MSNEEPIEHLTEEELSRRVFLAKFGGTLAGLAGIFGLAKTGGLFDEHKSKQANGYGATTYGGKKES